MGEILLYLGLTAFITYAVTSSTLLSVLVSTAVVGTAMMITAYQESKGE